MRTTVKSETLFSVAISETSQEDLLVAVEDILDSVVCKRDSIEKELELFDESEEEYSTLMETRDRLYLIQKALEPSVDELSYMEEE